MKRNAMKVEYRSVEGLIPYARNARTHNAEQVAQIASSIKEFGWTNPVLVDGENGIIAGHGRVMAARKLGITEVPVIELAHLSEAQKRAYILADNKLALNAGWDEEVLAFELDELRDLDFDLALVGFSQAELADLIGDPNAGGTVGLTDPDVAPDVQAEAVTKPGDVWVMGKHRVMCGDSTDAASVAMLMNGEKADLCFTSPPYGAGNVAKLRDHYERGAEPRKSFYNEHADNPDEWLGLMRGWYAAARDHCDLVVCNVQMLADNKVSMVQWLHETAGDLCDVAIWDKCHGAPQMQANVMNNAFEFLFVMGGNATRAIRFADFHGSVSNIVRISPKGKNDFAGVHRAVMPVDLALWVMRDLCVKAASIYEPFSGSGTTLIAAEQTGRRCYAMELSPQYVDVAVRRWQQFTGNTATLEADGRTFADIDAERIVR